MYIRIFHLVNRIGVQQTSLDPTIDEFYYDGSAHYRTLFLNGVYGKAQITLILWYNCDRGYCGTRCEEYCQEETNRTINTDNSDPPTTATGLNSNTQQNLISEQISSGRVSWSTESTITIVVSLVVNVLVFAILLIVILTIAHKLKGKLLN